jgi:hypothetical protein
MSVNITSWITEVAPGLRFCPNPLIKREVIKTLRDFCKKTKLWYEQLTAIDIVADTAAYALSSSNGDVASVKRAEVGDLAIDPIREDVLDRDYTNWRTTTGNPFAYFVDVSRNINLVYTPATASTGGLDVWVNLMPTLTATTVEDFLYDDHRDIITLGARARLMAHEDRPWSNAQKAEAYRLQYEAQRDDVRRQSGKMLTPAVTRQTLRSRANVISYF